jgi:hypothetical protein
MLLDILKYNYEDIRLRRTLIFILETPGRNYVNIYAV